MSAPRQRLFQQMITRSFHATPRVSKKFDVTQEDHMARAIRKVKSMKPKVVVEVMNACHVSIASKLLPLNAQGVPIWIRVLTHSKLLSDAALSYQMQKASRLYPHIGNYDSKSSRIVENGNDDRVVPVVAMDLADHENIEQEELQNFLHVLLGARKKPCEGDLTKNATIMVCGLPNAGKSTLIHISTRPRTLRVKKIKKKDMYIPPPISATPGWTLGVERYVALERKLPLWDVPGLRPRAEELDLAEYTQLLVSGAMQALPGVLDESEPLRRAIVNVLWKGLCRHAVVSGAAMPPQWAHAEAWLAEHQEKFFDETQQQESPASVVHHLMEYCRNGEYGGMVLEEGYQTPLPRDEAAAAIRARATFQPNRDTPVVAMNEAAMELWDIGDGVDARLVKERELLVYRHAQNSKLAETKAAANAAAEDSLAPSTETRPDPSTPKEQRVEPKESQHHERLPRDADKTQDPPSAAMHTTEHDSPRSTPATNSSEPSTVEDLKKSQNNKDQDVIILPWYQQRKLRCMTCAGFIKSKQNDESKFFGVPNNRVSRWTENDIRAFYSRAAEAFGVSLHLHSRARLLFKDSLACTLGKKFNHKKTQVYQKHGKNLGGWPVLNEDRPWRFRNDQPIPFKIVCTWRSHAACSQRSTTTKEE